MILGISSGRKNGVTSDAVKAVLEASGLEYEFISLSGKTINGCLGCVECVFDNMCKIKDDWTEIAKKMLEAEAVVFGAPNYYGTINALGHACLERTFCFRHQGAFNLKGKLGIIVSTSYAQDDTVQTYIERMMHQNKMEVIDKVVAKGYSQCYSCGLGHKCKAGKVVYDHGLLEKIEDKHLPPCFEMQIDTKQQAYKAGRALGTMLGMDKKKRS
jgi:multimeric flavodoxin WrbA